MAYRKRFTFKEYFCSIHRAFLDFFEHWYTHLILIYFYSLLVPNIRVRTEEAALLCTTRTTLHVCVRKDSKADSVKVGHSAVRLILFLCLQGDYFPFFVHFLELFSNAWTLFLKVTQSLFEPQSNFLPPAKRFSTNRGKCIFVSTSSRHYASVLILLSDKAGRLYSRNPFHVVHDPSRWPFIINAPRGLGSSIELTWVGELSLANRSQGQNITLALG